jgi:hypothetical protein
MFGRPFPEAGVPSAEEEHSGWKNALTRQIWTPLSPLAVTYRSRRMLAPSLADVPTSMANVYFVACEALQSKGSGKIFVAGDHPNDHLRWFGHRFNVGFSTVWSSVDFVSASFDTTVPRTGAVLINPGETYSVAK